MGTFWNGHKKGACLRVKLPICLWIKLVREKWKTLTHLGEIYNVFFFGKRNTTKHQHHNLHFTMIMHIFKKNLNFNELKKSRFKTRIFQFHIHEFRSNTAQQHHSTHMWLHYKLQRWNLAYSGKRLYIFIQ